MALHPLLNVVVATAVIQLAPVPAFAEVPADPAPAPSNAAPAHAPRGVPLLAASGALQALAEAGAGTAPEAGGAAPGSSDTAATDSWRWRRASVADYAGSAVGIAGTIFTEVEHGHPTARWKARNPFDEGIRDALRLGSREARTAAHTAGDAIMGLMIAAPVLDSLATLGIRDSRWDALWQTEVINLESFTFTSLVSSLLQNVIVPRERPFVRNCVGYKCEDSQQNRSMPSGHVAYALTGAGLICNHHEHQSLYGDAALDRAVCTTGIALAAAQTILRILADRHYATDVAVGAAVGLFSGFVLPRWMFYNWAAPEKGEEREGSALRQLTVGPLIYQGGGGLTCRARF